MFNVLLIFMFGICSLSVLISAISYTFRLTISHLSHTAGTTTWSELLNLTAKIDKITVVFEISDIFADLVFAIYLILLYNGIYEMVITAYICLVISMIGFVLILIKLKLASKLYNIFTKWTQQKHALIDANKDIKQPSDDDIREMHQILLDIKSYEFDVAIFDLFSIGLVNIPIICCILLLTKYHKWTFDILPLIIMIISISMICWKIMKLIVIKTGCNDSSDIPSKFASLNTYRPSWTNKNYNNDDDDDEDDDEDDITENTINEGNNSAILSFVGSDANDEKDTECTSLNQYFESEVETVTPVVTSMIISEQQNEEKIMEKIWINSIQSIPNDTPSLIKQDSRFENKKAKQFRNRTNTAHV